MVAVELRSDHLSGREILEYYESGFLCPGRVFSDDDIEALRDLVASVQDRERDEGRLYDLLDPDLWPDVDEPRPAGAGPVEFVFNMWRAEPNIRPFVFDPTLARWAAQLIGARRVRLLEDNALTKAPRSGGELKWHQDFPYWPLAQPNAVTAWVALDDTNAANGAMHMAAGSQLAGERLPSVFGTGTPYLRDQRPAAVKAIEDPATLGFDVQTITLAAGEVSFHSPLVWHASGPNTSNRQRRALVIRFVGDGTIWLGSQRYEYNYSDAEVGLAAGEPIGGEYFPLVPF